MRPRLSRSGKPMTWKASERSLVRKKSSFRITTSWNEPAAATAPLLTKTAVAEAPKAVGPAAELLASEQTYYQRLVVLTDVLLTPLVEFISSHRRDQRVPRHSEAISVCLGTALQIKEFTHHLLESIELAYGRGPTAAVGQAAEIGAVFKRMAPFLRLVSQRWEGWGGGWGGASLSTPAFPSPPYLHSFPVLHLLRPLLARVGADQSPSYE